VHVVTTNIKADGSRISLHNLGRNQSEKTRKEIEISFGLVKAQDRKAQELSITPVRIGVEYGKTETKKAIANVLNNVLKEYKFTTIGELNAVLNRYNVAADIGSAGSRIRKNNGILYRALDKNGNRVGVPIKASDFHFKPTHRNLKVRFQFHEMNPNRAKDSLRVRNSIDFTLYGKQNVSLPRLIKILEKDGIDTVTRKNEEGLLYGITYIDHRTKCVFNGITLGKQYSAEGIKERCIEDPFSLHQQKSQMIGMDVGQVASAGNVYHAGNVNSLENDKSLDSLLSPVKDGEYTPHQLKKLRRKKQKGLSMGF
jgi:hypothetical protein